MEIKGCYTALITPFKDGKICYAALQELIDEQIRSGVKGIIPAGTTGESPTLSFKEHKELIENVVRFVDRRCQVIAGTGGNATLEALELTRFAKQVGVDATLQVAPYYNKPSQEGLYKHFSSLANSVDLPIVLYNIPGRTGVEIGIDTLSRLSKNENIVAIKEASQDIERVSQTLLNTDLVILSGDDSKTLPMITLGAKGVISVASNLIPEKIVKLVDFALSDALQQARQLHLQLYPLFTSLFVETNPVPIKTALATMGRITEEFRLPLCSPSEKNRNILIQEMKKLDILK